MNKHLLLSPVPNNEKQLEKYYKFDVCGFDMNVFNETIDAVRRFKVNSMLPQKNETAQGPYAFPIALA